MHHIIKLIVYIHVGNGICATQRMSTAAGLKPVTPRLKIKHATNDIF